MKIRSVTHNNRREAFLLKSSNKSWWLPYSEVVPQPTGNDPIVSIFVDKELGGEGFGYVLESGKEGTVYSERVPAYLKASASP